MQAFANSVDEYFGSAEKILIVGMLKDKDISGSLDFIRGKFSTVITVTVDNPRTLTASELAEICKDKFTTVVTADSAEDAVNRAIQTAEEKNCAILVCGSLYLAGEIRPIFLEKLKK